MPAPGAGQDGVQIASGSPAENLASLAVVGHEDRRVAFAAARHLDGQGAAGGALDAGDQFLDADAMAGAEVEAVARPAGQQAAQGRDVSVSEIQHVDVVANGGAVAGVVVVAEDREVRALAEGHLDRQGNGVGLRLVPFADPALRVGAGGVEVAQHRAAEADIAAIVGQGLLDHQFGAAIGIEGA